MVMTLDFDNNTVTTEQGTIIVPNLADKRENILKILELEEISGEELRADINDMLSELGFTNVKA